MQRCKPYLRKPSRLVVIAAVIAIVSETGVSLPDATAQDAAARDAAPASNSPDKASPQARAEFLLERADQMFIEQIADDGEVKQAVRVPEPSLKYKNPLYEQQSDGVLLIWTVDSVPVAFASYSIRSEKNIFREFAICSDTPLRCMLDAKVVWAPKPQFTRRAFADSIPVPDNDRLRLRMMKRLAERCKSGNKRVLPTPLHRYQSANQQVIDGAVFTLSDTNDPEMLILIEAVRDNDKASPSWRYTLARMNSQPQQVHYEGELVWDLKGYWGNPRGPEDPYVEVQDSLLPPELSLQ